MTAKRKPMNVAAFEQAASMPADPVAVVTASRGVTSAQMPESPQRAPREEGTRQASRRGKVQVVTWVPEETRRRLKLLAIGQGRTVEEVLATAIDDILASH